MFYYADYNLATDTRRILAYDAKKHGMPRVGSPDLTCVYHGSLMTARVYNNTEDALLSWGKYINKPVVMPDGSETTPARYFGVDRVEDIFIPWSDVKGELWPGEY